MVEVDRKSEQDVIDEALVVLNSQHHRLMRQLSPHAPENLTIEQLRRSQLGRSLARLAAVARAEIREDKEQVLGVIDEVLSLLFTPPYGDDYTVPRSFWESDLGRMLSMAKYRTYDSTELISIGNAAQQLGVTRPTIYRWMDDRMLGYVRDEMSGRTFVVREDVEALRQQGGGAEEQ
ncbi:MAG TPA: excisionase family DNA-binding protein [Nitrolancea sp.]|nr:excisionase family DNA-binding protein [Nitrolancea sp.]